MSKRVNYYWRLSMTALSFLTFGMLGVLLSLTLFPILNFIPARDKLARNQFIVHKIFKSFVLMMRGLGVLSVSVSNEHKLGQSAGKLVIANHPSLIDVVLLIAHLPETNCIVKQSLWRNPCMSMIISAAGYIKNGAEPEDVLKACQQELDKGASLIIFPEGTRTTPGEALKMQRGAANIALRCSVDLLPVTIKVSPTTLTKSEPWYAIPASKPHFSLDIGDPIRSHDICLNDESDSRKARTITRYLQQHFYKELNCQ
ncbi:MULTISPECIES: lysophospholipid acyltransferase family protein [unclassified Agarivorans]|uniref:lysophospholipid acyltransferase family protein n=1 Tax=unclassified Agarivorans TaxID=2636026 RepID=UPI0026E434C5|nr:MULTISPECIES: lysophospholipid acyltransferase family protein [unclassified Agarivorans]MDO6685299.1 lysophospholipid acyltransferase family protein [Agarivorans sp. 3_MG-2023]MDO6715529.1 lysophospholipid acyltransferase family protein [Agarivorans sp. 2_MG-2023]